VPDPTDRGGETDDAAVPVLAAVIRRDDRWLLCLRPAHKRHGGLWEFPGGKLEAGESLEDAARRELTEELGVFVTDVGEPVYVRHDAGSRFVIEFAEVNITGTPQAIEHDEVRWVTLREVLALPLAPADRDFVDDWLRPRAE
jgi:8-oxo-dGTP diphosphatase